MKWLSSYHYIYTEQAVRSTIPSPFSGSAPSIHVGYLVEQEYAAGGAFAITLLPEQKFSLILINADAITFTIH